jgi:uncharacterized membrane protein YedE/YeeE
MYLFFGVVFGFLLSRAGATTQDFYVELFLFQDLQLMWVICSAVAVGMLGVTLLRRFYSYAILENSRLRFEGKPMRKGLISGSLMFGVGWGISGTCPGSAPAMLGEGKLMALFAIVGIVLGTYLYGRLASARGQLEGAARKPANLLAAEKSV